MEEHERWCGQCKGGLLGPPGKPVWLASVMVADGCFQMIECMGGWYVRFDVFRLWMWVGGVRGCENGQLDATVHHTQHNRRKRPTPSPLQRPPPPPHYR